MVFLLLCPTGKESPSKRLACEFESHQEHQLFNESIQMEKIKVNINPYYAYFSGKGQVFKLIHQGTIPRDIMAYSDFVIDSDGTVLKSRYRSEDPKFQHIIHLIRQGDDIQEYAFNPSNSHEIDLFFKRLAQQYNAFCAFRDL